MKLFVCDICHAIVIVLYDYQSGDKTYELCADCYEKVMAVKDAMNNPN